MDGELNFVTGLCTFSAADNVFERVAQEEQLQFLKYIYNGVAIVQSQQKTDFYRTCEPPNPVLVLIEPRFEGPSPRSLSDLEFDPHWDENDGCG